MEQNQVNNTEVKNRIFDLLIKNKKLIISFLIIVFLTTSSLIFIKIRNEKKNDFISEKYIEAGIYLSNKEMNKSIKIYDEIIVSKNKFYSILALNILIEKNLIKDKDKILNYFEIVEDLKLDKNQRDLLLFKKALYLKKYSNSKESERLLQKLIDSDSKLKEIVKEILSN
tara:strand:- start:70 stop:579 length:510 start_codon:yes stop_codon:yes gene_type:complete